ncbi:hypothetical protein TNCV_569611 [Trichonephila clavipes]|nr:hypothetical protein TNCV_569611 [Trichonephila clavipes]
MQTFENITKVKCPPLKLLRPLSSLQKSNTSISTLIVSTSSSSTQAHLLPSTSSTAATATVSEPHRPISMSDSVLSTNNSMFTPIKSSSIVSFPPSNSSIESSSACTTKLNLKPNSETCARKKKLL